MAKLEDQEGTYVADVDRLASFSAGSRKVGERVRCRRRSGSSSSVEADMRRATKSASTKASSASETASEATATSEASTAAEATAEATASAEASTASESGTGTSKAILADFERASLPIEAIELLDSVTSVIGRLECDDTGALGTSVLANMDVGADDSTLTS